jgi:hypothetical protein
MEYRIYILVSDSVGREGEIKRVIEADDFIYESFDSIEEAFEALRNKGKNYCNYTILPYIYLR